MYSAKKPTVLIASTTAALTFALGMACATGSPKLFFNGKVASSEVRTLNGENYVKISDMAKALGMTVVKRPDGFELTKAGGANQIDGTQQGKIGDLLFDGKWRFQVVSMETVSSYTLKSDGEPYPYDAPVDYNTPTRTITAKSGNTLLVLHCRAINGQKSTQNLWLGSKDTNTALTDTTGTSYRPVSHDVSGAPAQTKALLPGAKVEMPVVFCVPKDAQIKDLVFTLKNNNFSEKGNDVRVSLK